MNEALRVLCLAGLGGCGGSSSSGVLSVKQSLSTDWVRPVVFNLGLFPDLSDMHDDELSDSMDGDLVIIGLSGNSRSGVICMRARFMAPIPAPVPLAITGPMLWRPEPSRFTIITSCSCFPLLALTASLMMEAGAGFVKLRFSSVGPTDLDLTFRAGIGGLARYDNLPDSELELEAGLMLLSLHGVM